MSARLVALGLALGALAACGSAQPARPPVPTTLLAVLPLDSGPKVRPAAVPQDDGSTIVTAQIYRVLSEQTALRFAPDLSVGDLLASGALRGVHGQVERAVALGKALGADAVIVGTVTEYSPRVGTAFGASQGAAIAFDLGVVDVAGGEVVWQGNFAEAQQDLASNIFDAWLFWRAGARWLSASELAGLGVERLWPQLSAALEARDPTDKNEERAMSNEQ